MKWYAIVSGRVPGIYTSWPEASSQVKGFKGAIYKGFDTEKEAKDYMKASMRTEVKDAKWTIYTDGSYVSSPPRAGYGVLFVDNSNTDMMYAYAGRVKGKLTNNTGELTGVLTALKLLGDDSAVIYTDSEYVIKMITTPLGPKAANRELLQQIKDLMRSDISVKWVKGHSGQQYNEIADQLADIGRRANHYDTFEVFSL